MYPPLSFMAVFNASFRFLQSHVYDHARSTEGGFHHHHFLHVGVFQNKPEDERGIPHFDQVMTMSQEANNIP